MDFGMSLPATVQGGGGFQKNMNPNAQGYNPKTGQMEPITGYDANGPVFASAQNSTASRTPSQVIQDIIEKGTAAIPDSLKALSSNTTNTSTASAGVGTAIQGASDAVAGKVSDLIAGGIPDYTGQRVAGYSDPEQKGLDQLTGMAAGSGAGTSAMQKSIDQKTTPITAKQLGDVDMSKYMNPALSAEYDAILHSGGVADNALRARMAKSGAFGENMGVAEAAQDEATKRQLALAGSDAFKNASANAMSDVGALNTAAGQNQAASLTDAQRALTGGQAMSADQRATLAQMSGAGAAKRGVEQSGLDAQWQQYLTKMGLNMQLPGAAAGALSALPGGKTFTQTNLGPSPAGQQIGALVGLTGMQQQFQPKPMQVSGGNISG